MKNTLNSIRNVFRHNFPGIIAFELIYRFLTVLFYWWLCDAMLSLAMKAAGYSYITAQNLASFLLKPITIPVLLFLAFIGIVLLCYESSVLMTGYQASTGGYRLSFIRLVTFGTQRFIKKLRSRCFPLLMLSAPVFCGISLYLMYRLLIRLRLFTPIINEIFKRTSTMAVLGVVLFLLALITIPCIYLLFCVYYADVSLKGHGAHGKKSVFIFLIVSVLYTAVVNVLGYLLYKLFYFLLILLAAAITSLFTNGRYVYTYLLEISQDLDLFMLFFSSVITMILNIGVLSGLFFRFRKGALVLIPDYDQYKRPKKGRAAVFYSIVCIILAVCSFNTIVKYRNGMGLETYIQDVQITAHRGYSLRAPENTLPAIQLAAEALADTTEFDVQLTSDGEIILCHDSTLKRTAGVNRKISSLTCAEVQSYDVGAYFSDEFAGNYIPTLSQVFDEYAGKMRFEIELKNYAGNAELPQKVIDLIHEYNLVGQCTIVSTSYTFLKQVKELDPDIPTGYILSSVYGHYYTDPNIDFFSVNSAFLDESSVNAMHTSGKAIHAWTVNSRSEMIRLLNLGVDNIITDTPLYAREVLFSTDIGSFMDIIQLAIK